MRAFTLLSAAVLAAGCGGGPADRLPPPIRGPNGILARTVELTLNDLRGEPLSLASLQGKVVLVNVFATWCTPCVEEMPALDALDRADERFVLLPVSVDQTPEVLVPAFVEYLNLGARVLLADRGMIQGDSPFGPIVALPTSFLVDARGRHVETFVGPTPVAYLRRRIDDLHGSAR